MNKEITYLALKSTLLNYIDNETPRRYFICGNADIEEVEEFAESIVRECIDIISLYTVRMGRHGEEYLQVINEIKKHFGVEYSNE